MHWAIGVVRYSAGILEWTDRELKAMDVKTRKKLTMKERQCRKIIHEKKGRALFSVIDCVTKEELGLCEYVKASDKWMMKVVGKQLQERI